MVFNGISHYHNKQLGHAEQEERRRLLFVSATRARDILFVTGQSVAYGDKKNRVYNCFLMESFDVLHEDFQKEAS